MNYQVERFSTVSSYQKTGRFTYKWVVRVAPVEKLAQQTADDILAIVDDESLPSVSGTTRSAKGAIRRIEHARAKMKRQFDWFYAEAPAAIPQPPDPPEAPISYRGNDTYVWESGWEDGWTAGYKAAKQTS